jgi:hypothetical protein
MTNMMSTLTTNSLNASGYYQRQATIYWWLWFLVVIGFTAVTALFMLYIAPIPVPIGALLFIGSVVAICHQPRYGLYLIVFFALVGDSALLPWYPFIKNFSSAESILYLNGALIFSPFELYLAIIFCAWLGGAAMQRQLSFHAGVLLAPTLAFMGTLVIGLLYGLATGGNLNIALWEVRPIFYLPLLLILTSNLLKTRAHVNQLFWVAMVALFIEGVVGSYHYFVTLGMDLSAVQAITEHSAAIHMNTLFVVALAVQLYRASMWKRILLPLMAMPVLIAYIATQRRAAFLSLGIALVFLAILLYRENRKRFWQIVPIVALLATLYIGVFWQSSGALGLPAQAVKSVVAPEENSADYQSNLYRDIENINVSYTIHKSPLSGVGFGNKFHITMPMPDISFFIWWEYIVHNSIFWIWMKTGIFGFLSMLFLVGLSIITGTRLVTQIAERNLRAITLMATLYVVMHFLYAYVDMSWDNQSMIYLGTALGMINCIESIAARAVPTPAKRWPWQLNSTSLPTV